MEVRMSVTIRMAMCILGEGLPFIICRDVVLPALPPVGTIIELNNPAYECELEGYYVVSEDDGVFRIDVAHTEDCRETIELLLQNGWKP
jgi:hypothetical protein